MMVDKTYCMQSAVQRFLSNVFFSRCPMFWLRGKRWFARWSLIWSERSAESHLSRIFIFSGPSWSNGHVIRYLQCNDCEECGAIPAHICNSDRKCRLSTILTRYIYVGGKENLNREWETHCHCDKNAFYFLPALSPLKVALVTWLRRCTSNAYCLLIVCCFVSICQSQVLELSVAQRDAEQRRVADSSSAQESLLSVTAKYRWL